jgi:hypothetical protein
MEVTVVAFVLRMASELRKSFCCDVLFATVIFWLVNSAAYAVDLSSQEITELISSSIKSIATVEARFQLWLPKAELADKESISGAELDEFGRFLLQEYDWAFQASGDKEVMSGRFFSVINGKGVFSPMSWSYDGETLLAHTPLARNGRRGPLADWRLTARNPLVLIGCTLGVSPQRDLTDILRNSKQVTLTNHPDGVELRAQFEDAGRAVELQVTLEPSHGFLPKKIIEREIDSSIRIIELSVDKFSEVSNGIWLPIEGRRSLFYKKRIYPEGVSEADFQKLSQAEKNAMWPKIKLIESLMGSGEEFIKIIPNSISVNHPIAKDRFSIAFPVGTMIWDDRLQYAVQVTSDGEVPLKRGINRPFPWLLLVNVVIVGVLLLFIVLRNKVRRNCA